jgi:predicted NAD/FAD-dependent oxidoreductase
MAQADNKPFIIVGSGIGGLGAALGLARALDHGARRFGQGRGLGPRLGIGTELHHCVGAGVARHDDDGVLEVDVAEIGRAHV